MSKKFYVLDEKGSILSADGKKRYRLLEGEMLKNFLDSSESLGRYFITLSDDAGELCAIETSYEQACDFNKEKDRNKYIRKVKIECDITFISGNTPIEDDEGIELLDTIPDETVNVEDQVLKEETLERLSRALCKLSSEEYKLIHALYLGERRYSQKELSLMFDVSQQAISKRQATILKKLKNIF